MPCQRSDYWCFTFTMCLHRASRQTRLLGKNTSFPLLLVIRTSSRMHYYYNYFSPYHYRHSIYHEAFARFSPSLPARIVCRCAVRILRFSQTRVKGAASLPELSSRAGSARARVLLMGDRQVVRVVRELSPSRKGMISDTPFRFQHDFWLRRCRRAAAAIGLPRHIPSYCFFDSPALLHNIIAFSIASFNIFFSSLFAQRYRIVI